MEIRPAVVTAYEPPRLIVYGRVSELTHGLMSGLSGGGGGGRGGGNGGGHGGGHGGVRS